jgi:hypothetical protein
MCTHITLRVELPCFLFPSLLVANSVGISTDLKQSANFLSLITARQLMLLMTAERYVTHFSLA